MTDQERGAVDHSSWWESLGKKERPGAFHRELAEYWSRRGWAVVLIILRHHPAIAALSGEHKRAVLEALRSMEPHFDEAELLEMARRALREHVQKHGKDSAKAILKTYDAERISQVPPQDLEGVIRLARAPHAFGQDQLEDYLE